MITGKEMKEGRVDVQKQHIFVSFSVEDIREDLQYEWAFDPENEDNLGNPDVIVSDLWIEDAILDVCDNYNYEYASAVNMREDIISIIIDKTEENYKTKVSAVTGVLANDSIRGGTDAS
jgi:hypothetical protein